MAKELDALLDSIEKPGGFYDASVTAHKQSVAELEQGNSVISERCQKWKVSSIIFLLILSLFCNLFYSSYTKYELVLLRFIIALVEMKPIRSVCWQCDI